MAFTMEVPDEAAIKKEVQEQVKPAPEEVAVDAATGSRKFNKRFRWIKG